MDKEDNSQTERIKKEFRCANYAFAKKAFLPLRFLKPIAEKFLLF